jgi:hypothetical protein
MAANLFPPLGWSSLAGLVYVYDMTASVNFQSEKIIQYMAANMPTLFAQTTRDYRLASIFGWIIGSHNTINTGMKI